MNVKELVESVKVWEYPIPLSFQSRPMSLVEKSDFDRVVEELTKWNKVEDCLPDEGVEVFLQNDKWINEDFNPKGIRIGFLDGLGYWISAYWCNYHDEYHTRNSDEDDEQFELSKAEDQIPNKWRYIY